ncbi:MAG: hypothetical protein IJX47_02555 [Clostridia bacterium]|nr:hypothetical protein [Clostridia bacterium]
MSHEPAKLRTRQRVALMSSLLLLCVLTAVQLYFYLTGYEFDNDLYVHGSLPTVTAVLWICAAAGAILLNCPLPGKVTCSELKIRPSVTTDTASLLCAAALAGSLLLPILLKNGGSDMLGNLLASDSDADSTARLMLIASMVLAIPAALHFILQFAHHKSYPQTACALLLWAAFSALRIYFDMRYLLMSPRRIMHLVALIAVMLFLIAELRQARGVVTHRFYAIAASLMIILAGCDALSNLILAAMGWIALGSEICTYIFLLAIALYAGARLAALCTDAKSKPIPAADAPIAQSPAPSDAVETQTDGTDLPSEGEEEQ